MTSSGLGIDNASAIKCRAEATLSTFPCGGHNGNSYNYGCAGYAGSGCCDICVVVEMVVALMIFAIIVCGGCSGGVCGEYDASEGERFLPCTITVLGVVMPASCMDTSI